MESPCLGLVHPRQVAARAPWTSITCAANELQLSSYMPWARGEMLSCWLIMADGPGGSRDKNKC